MFVYFSRKYDATVQIEDTVMYWVSMIELDNRIATLRNYGGMNFRSYSESKKSFEKMKKECYAMEFEYIQSLV